jgi:hypothetical protein
MSVEPVIFAEPSDATMPLVPEDHHPEETEIESDDAEMMPSTDTMKAGKRAARRLQARRKDAVAEERKAFLKAHKQDANKACLQARKAERRSARNKRQAKVLSVVAKSCEAEDTTATDTDASDAAPAVAHVNVNVNHRVERKRQRQAKAKSVAQARKKEWIASRQAWKEGWQTTRRAERKEARRADCREVRNADFSEEIIHGIAIANVEAGTEIDCRSAQAARFQKRRKKQLEERKALQGASKESWKRARREAKREEKASASKALPEVIGLIVTRVSLVEDSEAAPYLSEDDGVMVDQAVKEMLDLTLEQAEKPTATEKKKAKTETNQKKKKGARRARIEESRKARRQEKKNTNEDKANDTIKEAVIVDDTADNEEDVEL